ncbi:MAG TPA: type II toxin-antitoxin system Phd/YefM family antitoxin, partial [Vicinamibacterales bacterium]|nr:type II toxin-antitoxin system Phd/YefM family antitoxin [Vicinamibacterales bacterium]
MVKMAASALRSSLSDAISRVSYAGERIALQRNGKAVAGIVSVADLQRLEALDDQADLKAARR